MNYKFDYSKQKDLILRETRGVGFEEIIDVIASEGYVADLKHPKKENQRILLVKFGTHIFIVPYVNDDKRELSFLKTAYPSRKYTRLYKKDKRFYKKL